MRKISSLLLSVLLLTLGAQRLLASTVTYAVGSCEPKLKSFLTISAAVAALPAPNLVKVCPGTYPEQVVITQPMTLEGITSGSAAQVIIVPPAGGLVQNATTDQGFPVAAQIVAASIPGSVTISDISVDNQSQQAGDNVFDAGIFLQNTSGTIEGINAFNFGQSDNNGPIAAIWVEGGSTSPSVTVENSVFYSYTGATAILAGDDSTPLTVSIKSNQIDGSGGSSNPGGTVGINLLQVAATVVGNDVVNTTEGIVAQTGTTGRISNNFVSDSPSFGIYVDSTSSTTVNSNKVVGSSTGIEVSGPGIIEGNSIFNSQVAIQFSCSTSPNVHSNIINGASIGLGSVPQSVNSSNKYWNVAITSSGC
jgi:hypothetical protein